jgi:hypothetical protein
MTALGKAIPWAFGLLPNKEKETYLRLANYIKEEVRKMPEVRVQSIMMNYEKVLLQPLRQHLPVSP